MLLRALESKRGTLRSCSASRRLRASTDKHFWSPEDKSGVPRCEVILGSGEAIDRGLTFSLGQVPERFHLDMLGLKSLSESVQCPLFTRSSRREVPPPDENCCRRRLAPSLPLLLVRCLLFVFRSPDLYLYRRRRPSSGSPPSPATSRSPFPSLHGESASAPSPPDLFLLRFSPPSDPRMLHNLNCLALLAALALLASPSTAAAVEVQQLEQRSLAETPAKLSLARRFTSSFAQLRERKFSRVGLSGAKKRTLSDDLLAMLKGESVLFSLTRIAFLSGPSQLGKRSAISCPPPPPRPPSPVKETFEV